VTTGVLTPGRAGGRAAPRGRPAFSFTPRTLRLLALGLLLVVPVWIDRRALVAVGAWDVVVLAAWLLDLRRLPRPASLIVSRSWAGPLTLGARQTATLEVRNEEARPIELVATDFAGVQLRRDPAALTMTVAARGTARDAYEVVPGQRGDFELDFVALRYRSRLALAERWAGVSLPQRVRVYPDFAEARRHAFALIRARQIVMEKRRAHAHGLGRDFESLREFQPGDEPRDVCWTATARRGRLVTRTYQPERSQTVWIMIDAGRLMRARDHERTGLDRAVNAAFALAQVASAAGDRVALLAYGRRTQQRLPPGRGAAHLRAFVEALALTRSETAEADHARAAAAVISSQKRRALIVWMTDLAETVATPEVVESAARLVPQHVLLFAVTRPAELSAIAASVPAGERDMYRVMAAQEMIERRARLLRQLRQRGAMAIEMPSPDLTAAVIDRYLTVKERNLL
jgi:uncharacterized protein (DUF58 family)